MRFSDEPWPPKIAWSLVVMKLPESRNEYDWIANVHFLVHEAPHDSLVSGREFELYEGGKLVANGELIAETAGQKT